MSTISSTRSAMYHGVDFWKIVAWVKDELAARLNSFVRRWDSSSKTMRLTIGRGVFQLALRSRKCAGLDRHQRRRVLFGARRQLLIANVVYPRAYAFGTICCDLDCFTRTDVPRRIPICLTEADSFPNARRAAIPPFAVVRPRPVLPPGDRPPLLRAVGPRRWIGWAWGT
jgi:hypothetical protein